MKQSCKIPYEINDFHLTISFIFAINTTKKHFN